MMFLQQCFIIWHFLQYRYKARVLPNHSSFSNFLVKTIAQIDAGVIMLTRIGTVSKLSDVFGQSKSVA